VFSTLSGINLPKLLRRRNFNKKKEEQNVRENDIKKNMPARLLFE